VYLFQRQQSCYTTSSGPLGIIAAELPDNFPVWGNDAFEVANQSVEWIPVRANCDKDTLLTFQRDTRG
jgi:hypothetical protein